MTAPAGGPPRAIDLNADLGEGADVSAVRAVDVGLLGVVTSANVATGAHAGGGRVMSLVVAEAVAAGVAVGAHPSYRDRATFGRTSWLSRLQGDRAAQSRFVADLTEQVSLVSAELAAHGQHLRHVKAHGALYNDAVAHPLAADLMCAAMKRLAQVTGRAVPVVTLPQGWLWQACGEASLPVLAEGFVDRAYTESGTLVPRSQPGAVLTGPAAMAGNALRLAGVAVDTLCVHGDTPGALAGAVAVRTALQDAGWRLAPPAHPGNRWP